MKLVFFLITSLLFHQGLCQHKFIILDANDTSPVPYATIKVLGAPRGAIASEKGEFHLTIFPGDSIVVSSVGYDEKVISGKQFSDTIFLFPRIKVLAEITVREKIFIRSLHAGNGARAMSKKLPCEIFKGKKVCWNWGPTGVEEEFGERIVLPYPKRRYLLRNIRVPVERSGCWGPLLLRIYAADANGFPGEVLLVKPVAVMTKMVRDNRLFIDLTREDITFDNARYFFVSFGWLPGARDEKCITNIIFPVVAREENTYTRSLLSNSYSWQQVGYVKGKTPDLHVKPASFYAVELWEMK